MSCSVKFANPSAGDKPNDYAIDALKQLITLAAGILALNITFIKDFIGPSRPNAMWTMLVPAGWICLLMAIWLAWVAIANAARSLGTGEASGYAFSKGTLSRRLARGAQDLFLLGLIVLGTFAVKNFIF
jgi:hypothetical protein